LNLIESTSKVTTTDQHRLSKSGIAKQPCGKPSGVKAKVNFDIERPNGREMEPGEIE